MSDTTISDRLTGLSPAVIHVYTQLVTFTDSATVDDIAQAADIARSSTFKALVALEKRNLAHRNRGIKNGPDRRPDLWHATHTAPAPPFEQPGTREEPVAQTLATPRSAAPVPDSSHSMREPYGSTAHKSDEKSDASASRRTASSAPPPVQCPAALQASGVTPATASPGGSRRLARGALRQRRRHGKAGAVRAILHNPRHNGYEVWNKQRKEERLTDIDDVTLGHRTTMTHNPTDEWIWSNEPAHTPLIPKELFEAAQRARRQRARVYQRQERPNRRSSRRAYVLRGRVRCTLCGRKMQPSAIRDRVYYRCEYKEQEVALYPGLDHPRTINLREDIICRALDAWIARAFAPDRLTAPITALSQAGIAASSAQPQTPEQAQARQAIKECERRLARYQTALDSGADPAVVTQWINDAQRDREAAQKKLDALPTGTRRKEPPLTADQIRAITERLGDIAQRIQAADAEKKEPLYEALGITIAYDHATRTATVRSRPSIPYRYKESDVHEF